MKTNKPDLSSLLPDDATLKSRRAALVEAVASGPPSPQPTPPWRRRGPRLALGGSVALAAVAAVLVASAGNDEGSTAVAVETQEGGGVTITVNSPEDADALEAALAEAGIRSQVSWLPAGMTCREPRFTQSTARTALGARIGTLTMAGPRPAMTIGLMTTEQYREFHQTYRREGHSENDFFESIGNITLDPTSFGPAQSIVIWGAPGPSPSLSTIVNGPTGPYEVDPEGGYEASIAIAEGPVEPCDPVAAPGGGSLEQTARVIEEEAADKGFGPSSGG